ncbi:type II toxin-antitoxin system VapC family toxin [Anabaena aphanizomenioides LEGE 00250]|uniref:Type II toxin-antitoxin system VapC family toxin n=1 Tax=Sphaerospermopsis aphanizomenoides LEGE 00250 TaxID=2777972 RepID=A0ABR9VK30_9CYAN|nr:type II toxin-antitoxin system VapC family toxin [Sphaerospermopsis aphanizomenoides]MBE9238866.1 type II toxin-antitoxin system VapC family toxin [Sphaerospermopsis aphanizomenoides LEGE 00250]
MYLLDTNHCSLIFLKNQTILDYIKEVGETNIATTIITVGELTYMAENSTYKERNLSRIDEFLADIRVYYVDEKTAKIYGQIKAGLINKFGPKQKTKRQTTKVTQLGFDENDLWITAIAIRNQLTLVSADTDFTRIKTVIDFSLENWRDNNE